MIVTVLWEDQRGSLPKSFGPDELLVACLVDKTGRARGELKNVIKPVPKKGVGKLLKVLEGPCSPWLGAEATVYFIHPSSSSARALASPARRSSSAWESSRRCAMSMTSVAFPDAVHPSFRRPLLRGPAPASPHRLMDGPPRGSSAPRRGVRWGEPGSAASSRCGGRAPAGSGSARRRSGIVAPRSGQAPACAESGPA